MRERQRETETETDGLTEKIYPLNPTFAEFVDLAIF